MSTPVSTIRGLGAAMEAACARAGIDSAEHLRDLGAGTKPHFIGYYALHMALQGRPWNDCKGAEKAAFRTRFDALMTRARQPDEGLPPDLASVLDRMGVLPRKSGR